MTWSHRRSGISETRDCRNLFHFVGADPETDFIGACPLAVDAAGFVLTSRQAEGARAAARQDGRPCR